MPKIRECIVCGKRFLSEHGRNACSDICREEKIKKQNQKGNYRRYNDLVGIPETRICQNCGKNFESKTYTKYCSDECREESKRKIVKENSREFYIQNREHVIENVKANKKLKSIK